MASGVANQEVAAIRWDNGGEGSSGADYIGSAIDFSQVVTTTGSGEISLGVTIRTAVASKFTAQMDGAVQPQLLYMLGLRLHLKNCQSKCK